jgi:DNA primase
MSGDEERHGVKLSSLDQEVFPDAGVTKRELLDYLEAVSGRMLPELHDRLLSVVRVLRGQGPFMQKNLPKYTPEWVARRALWADRSRREVVYALCNDLRSCSGSATSARSSTTRRCSAVSPRAGRHT